MMLAAAPARAENSRNRFFFHPTVTLVTVALPLTPTIVALTYERTLSSPGNSCVWQPQIFFGEVDRRWGADALNDATVTQYGTTQYLGWRHYFGGGNRGAYLQGSGAAMVDFAQAEWEGDPDKASGTVIGIAGLGYFGYSWAHVFLDAGAGIQGGGGDIENARGRRSTIASPGPAFDFNLGFGF